LNDSFWLSLSTFLDDRLISETTINHAVMPLFGGTLLKISWYWISMHFYKAKAPVLLLTMMALLDTGDPPP